MSRSMRHTPIIPVAKIESEKDEKRTAHQRDRKWLHDHLKPQMACMEDFDIKSFHLHPHGGRDEFGKGGREFLGHRVRYEDPRALTK